MTDDAQALVDELVGHDGELTPQQAARYVLLGGHREIVLDALAGHGDRGIEVLAALAASHEGLVAGLQDARLAHVNGHADPETDALFAEIDREHGQPCEQDSWEPIPLGPVLAGDTTPPIPAILRREDGRSLFYDGAVNGTHGESGIGKSWVIVLAVVQEIHAGRAVLILDYEDTAATLVTRLRAFGAADDVIARHVIYVRPSDVASDEAVDRLCALVVARNVTYAAIDSVGEALAVEGLNEDKDAEVGPWLRALPRRLADAGAAVHLTDHLTKTAENPLYPSGSKRKRAAITGSSFLVELDRPFVKTTSNSEPAEGRLRLTCAKDRHGNYARGELVATFTLASWPDGGVTARLWPPMPSDERADLPVILAARDAVRVAKERGEPVSQRVLVSLMSIKASTDTKRAGIELAVAKGALAEHNGPRNSRLYTYACELET